MGGAHHSLLPTLPVPPDHGRRLDTSSVEHLPKPGQNTPAGSFVSLCTAEKAWSLQKKSFLKHHWEANSV